LRVLGCDTDKTGINLATKQVKGLTFSSSVQFKCCSFQDCNIDPASADVIILADVIEHLEDPLSVLQEIKRSGKPGGQLIITTPMARKGRLRDNNHICEYTEESLKLLLSGVFPYTVVKPFTPVILYKVYKSSFVFRYLFNALSIIGINPFCISLPCSKHVMLCSVSCF
jgi:ubiquinone/menaquinone biosynthesis C-methylase UbiE